MTLPETIESVRTAGPVPVTFIDASLDDWDKYETLHWLTGEAWLVEHPDDSDTGEIGEELDTARNRYVLWQHDLLGWAILVCRKRYSGDRMPGSGGRIKEFRTLQAAS